jgi:predicted permease
VADPGYLRAIGLTLLQGRWFEATDSAKGRHVCVVDRILVDRYWKGQDPIGKRIQLYGPDRSDWFVVGVVGRVKVRSLEENSEKEAVYFPAAQSPDPMMMFVLRAQGDPGPLATSVREAVRSIDSNVPVFNIRTMTQRMDAAAEPRRAPMILLSVFSGLAMVLAMLGVYGVLAYAVAQRTTEFGVRMALGASPGRIAVLVLKSALVIIGIGVACGLAGYLAFNRLVAAVLFGTPSTDPLMLSLAPLILGLVALAACLIPVLRATTVEPMTALRQE